MMEAYKFGINTKISTVMKVHFPRAKPNKANANVMGTSRSFHITYLMTYLVTYLLN